MSTELQHPQPAKKLVVMFKPAGDAPILKQSKVKVDSEDKFSKVVQFLRKQLAREHVFVYLKEAFAPSLDEKLAVLHKAYAVDGKLVVNYACTPAWG